jgi:lipocalin
LDRYSGTWFEVASLKEGFAGEGQKDCHCTAGLYTMNDEQRLSVKTFCVHGKPTGKISGIEGRVTCSDQQRTTTSPASTSSSSESSILDSAEYEQCKLNFPSIPFIPPEPYTVLETDYDSFALVEGAKDKSFVQVYSRTPNPGKPFIARQIQHLERDYGYKKNAIRATPQDCSQQLMTKMDGMMKSPGMTSMFQNTTENTIDELLKMEEEQFDGIALQGPRNPLNEAKNLVNLFQMFAQ